MCPIASQLMGKTNFQGSRCKSAAAALLLSLCLGLPPSVTTCPPSCLCTSDIISCSGCNLSVLPSDFPNYATSLDLSHNALTVLVADWIARPFDRLTTLVLSRNSISHIAMNTFVVTPQLLHLDLSSNRLTELHLSTFAGLNELRELLLFGNQIVHISPGAFNGLHSLVKLYLSGNRLEAFPSELYMDPAGPRNLTFLDLSSNRISKVPIQSLLSLTRQSGIYLQENPLLCDCALLALLEYWMWKEYRPLVDFRNQYSCRDDATIKPNCSQEGVEVLNMPLEPQTYKADPGKWVSMPCPGFSSVPGKKELAVYWVTPRTVLNSSADDVHARLMVLPNGTLEIRGALMEDSGSYFCVAARGYHHDPSKSLEVSVVVGNSSASSTGGLAHRSGTEHFNTAFTTLASCVVSIILVLLYLYLTPCRCRDSRGGASRGCGGRAFILCSDPREVESGQQRTKGKRVAFLDPQAEQSAIGGAKLPMMNSGHVATEGILKNGSRTLGQTLTDTADMD